jgi:hypothetical protein
MKASKVKFDKPKVKESDDEWDIIRPGLRGARLGNADKEVYAVRVSVNCTEKNSRVVIALDLSILKILKMEVKESVQVMISKNNPCLIKLTKHNKGAAGFHLYKASGHFVRIYISKASNPGLAESIKDKRPHWVYFEKSTDGIVVDVSKPLI